MNCITWYEAMSFCAWDGGYLPTEAEWNYAATGGDQQRAYPWSVPAKSLTFHSSLASYQELGPNSNRICLGDAMPACALTDLITVGTRPYGVGRWGQSDLAGNAYEWTLDWYASQNFPNPCTDCANLTEIVSQRVLRGGAFNTSDLRTGGRASAPEESRYDNVGVRCARAP
jgi:sulfatase modifying factor 1